MRKALQEFEFDPAWGPRDNGSRAHEAAIAGSAAALQNGKPVFTIEQIVQQLTREGAVWIGIGSNPVPNAGLGTITYAFFDFAGQVYSSERNEFQPLSAAQRDAVRTAFAIWGDVLGVTFVEGSVATADINLGNLNTSETYFSAYANFPSRSLAGEFPQSQSTRQFG